MKLQFEPDLDYQLAAVEAVCALFRGQEVCRPEFTAARGLEGLDASPGVGNRLRLLDDELHANLNRIQLQNGLRPSKYLDSGDFSVEMETGTGKTYVYLRTIFELNRRYGFTKFIIVVPSVAIKEGVHKTLRITEDHFRSLYANVPYEHSLYDSGKLGQIREFAASPDIRIMVVTVGAINKKDVNNLYRASEKTGGEQPIELLRATRPVLIVDEPQSVDGGLRGRGRQALGALDPLCTLRYSATHREEHYMVYRLDAVAAYERKLVKQIEVASGVVEGDRNRAYVRILEVHATRGAVWAVAELDVLEGAAVVRKSRRIKAGDDLEALTGRAVYHDCRVGEILAARGRERVAIRAPGGEHGLEIGEAVGGLGVESIQRQMLRQTILEHLDKELRLTPLGIKVLSLFFIDQVDKYREPVAGGAPIKGEYARLFEAEYRRAIQLPAYASLLKGEDPGLLAAAVHEGYFSIDKKGAWADTRENTQSDRDAAERAYHLIMRDKERLLSFETPLKFIFSHSALREGWDNPNVFQICALRDMASRRELRQTIGRGLRLCVNQEGARVPGFEVNTLTVIATESFQEFAGMLQREIEEDTGIRFGQIAIRNADERRALETGEAVLPCDDFKALGDRVPARATSFDNEALILACIQAIAAARPIPRTRITWQRASLAIGRGGVAAVAAEAGGPIALGDPDLELPDLLTELQERTRLTRRSLARILVESGRLDDFKRNPQAFIEIAAEAIDACKRQALAGGDPLPAVQQDLSPSPTSPIAVAVGTAMPPTGPPEAAAARGRQEDRERRED